MIPIAKPIFGEEEKNAVMKVLETGRIAQGPKVEELESKFSDFCGAKYSIAVCNGTAGLHTALKAIGIREGDEVITTPFTFIATANSILMCGAKPVFADIESDTFNISPEEVSKKISKKTKAILAVDLYGLPADFRSLRKLADEHSLLIVEDACQAIGAVQEGVNAGNLGDVGVFSFYATKNITCGEGGIVTTKSKEFADTARMFKNHGRSLSNADEYVDLGYNFRMTDISAAILIEQLKKAGQITEQRIRNAEFLIGRLARLKWLDAPKFPKQGRHVFHQFTIRVKDGFKFSRDDLQRYLKEGGVDSKVYYPMPVHLSAHFMKMGYKEGDFPVAEKASRQILSLPVYSGLAEGQLEGIASCIERFGEKWAN